MDKRHSAPQVGGMGWRMRPNLFGNKFFCAYGFWHCGEGVQTILLMWYMAFHAHLSPAEIGFYQALQLAPFLIFTAAGGSLTDRIGPRASFAMATGAFAVALGIYGMLDPVVGFNEIIDFLGEGKGADP